MRAEEILTQLNTVFDDVFEGYGGKVMESTTAADIQEWDSLTNIELMVALEESFGIKFTTAEISRLQNVGDLVRVIQSKTGA